MSACIVRWRSLLLLLFLLSAVPVAIIFSLERSTLSSPRNLRYRSQGWLRESAKWDANERRVLVSSFDGSIGQIRLPESDAPPTSLLLEETVVTAPPELAGRSFLGLAIDHRRNRVLVAVADPLGGRFGDLAAYDLKSWRMIFLTQLSGRDGKTLVDDVAVDDDGNAYVTDAKANKIFKVGVNGDLVSTIEDDAFLPKKWYLNLVGLNGIVYHPDRFLLVVHTSSGTLLRIDVDNNYSVHKVDVQGSLKMGDGMELLSPTQLVIAGSVVSGRLVESQDGWKTATVTGRYFGPLHRVATSVLVRDGKAYLHHLVGFGLGKREHVMTEAVFSPFNSTTDWF